MKKLFAGLLLCLGCGNSVLAAEPAAPLQFGLFPSLIPRTLVSMYDPLRLHLEQALGQSVQLYSSPDFISFARRTNESTYDIVLTAPHLAYVAMEDAGYVPVASYKLGIRAMLLVRKDQTGMSIDSLRGKAVAVPDINALVTFAGEELLLQHGLSAGRDYRVIKARGHQGAAMKVVNGEADLAFIGNLPYNQLADDVKASLTVLTESPTYPAQYFLVSKHLSQAKRKRIQQALIDFTTTKAGQQLMEYNQFGAIVAANARQLDSVRGMAGRVQKQLASPQQP